MQESLKKEWDALSKQWIHESRYGKNSNRTALLDKPVLALCGDVRGKRIIDLGCGEGRFCRILAEYGAAYVLGVDLCKPMIVAAKEITTESVEYKNADVQNLDFIADEQLDVAVSYLNQCDLPDIDANNREVYRVLKSGGRFVVANLHPMRSAYGKWQKNESGEKQHVILDNYFDEGARHWKMLGVEFTNFHRTLETYTRSFTDAGFILKQIAEPTAEPAVLDEHPDLHDELRVPNFIIYVLEK